MASKLADPALLCDHIKIIGGFLPHVYMPLSVFVTASVHTRNARLPQIGLSLVQLTMCSVSRVRLHKLAVSVSAAHD